MLSQAALDQILWDENGPTPETSGDQREDVEDENAAKNHECSSKLHSVASSSDLTQGTPIVTTGSKDHDSRTQIASDEVNSSIDHQFYSCFGTESMSDFIQVTNMLLQVQKTDDSNTSLVLLFSFRKKMSK